MKSVSCHDHDTIRGIVKKSSMAKNKVAARKHKSTKWEDPKVINDDPMTDNRIRQFIHDTEGTENKGGAEITTTRSQMTEKEIRKQQAAMKRLQEKGFPIDNC